MESGGVGHTLFGDIVSIENLFSAWNDFRIGKQQKQDVQMFALSLEDNLFELYETIAGGRYEHAPYVSFLLRDPKLRRIHKPAVKDRVLHHAIVRAIEPLFEPHFIFNSYSSRKEKGTHRAVARLRKIAWQMSRNNTRTVWIVHGDVRKFFDSVDHKILLHLLRRRIGDSDLLLLLEKIIHSFHTSPGKGIPLGNLTSQLFSNVYLDRLDQYVVNMLGEKRYIRYADDFVIVSRNKLYLESMITLIRNFLGEHLQLELHPKKIILRKWHQGMDFLGYVSFPYHTILRPRTKRRMFRHLRLKQHKLQVGQMDQEKFDQTVQSYLGMLGHCRSYAIEQRLRKAVEKIEPEVDQGKKDWRGKTKSDDGFA